MKCKLIKQNRLAIGRMPIVQVCNDLCLGACVTNNDFRPFGMQSTGRSNLLDCDKSSEK